MVRKSGAVRVALAAVLFGLLGALVKRASQDLPSSMIVFFRNAAGFITLLFFLRKGLSLRTGRFGAHFGRSLAGVASMYLSFYSIAHMRLADAYTLTYTAPLFMPFLARWWLGEPMPRHSGGPLALGFVGVLLLLKPSGGLFQPVALVALASGMLSAVAQVGIRQLTRSEPPLRIVFYFGLIGSLLTAPALVKTWVEPSWGMGGVLVGLGVMATVAQLFMTEGYRLVSPGDVGALMYLAVAVAGVTDWVFWGRVPDSVSLLGMFFIMAAGIWILRETPDPVAEKGA